MRKRQGLCMLLVLSLLAALLGGCGSEDYASQEQFLADLARGIDARLAITAAEDGVERTPEELSEYYLRLVDCELELLGPYEERRFEDETFDRLAHSYIDACRQQRLGAENYRDSALYPALWNHGRAIRAAVITELYTRYGLPIRPEQAAQYAPTRTETLAAGSAAVGKDYSDCVSAAPLPVWVEHYSDKDYFHYDLLVTNASADRDLHVAVSAQFYDGTGAPVGSDRQELSVARGTTQYLALKTDAPFADAQYRIEQAEEEQNWRSVTGGVVLSTGSPGGRAQGRFSNKSGETVDYLVSYCVFFRGEAVADVRLGLAACSGAPLKPGETRYEQYVPRQKADYDRIEIYFNAWAGR